MTGWRILAVSCAGPAPTDLPEPHRPLLLVFPADAEGEALAGAIAAAHDAAVVGRITSMRRVGHDLIVSRSTHGGQLTAQLRLKPGLAVATANDAGDVDGTITLGKAADLPVDCSALENGTITLEGARIVIGGGRGLDADGFAVLNRIARAVGGAVAASLPAVDLGLAPVACQVGQSGKFVNPFLYLTAGISGTLQHFAGVGPRVQIVAINADAQAPIFRFADIGVVADARVLLPLLADLLEAKRAAQCMPDTASAGPPRFQSEATMECQ
ncbi:MAG: FAD-binding protein, partial [Novosphingobium sp.]|nr:FAD-binding protein [Novosphingobium sp.]